MSKGKGRPKVRRRTCENCGFGRWQRSLGQICSSTDGVCERWGPKPRQWIVCYCERGRERWVGPLTYTRARRFRNLLNKDPKRNNVYLCQVRERQGRPRRG